MSDIRLQAGIQLCDAVKAAKGENADIERVLKERPDFFLDMGAKLVELSRQIQGDADCFRFTDDAVVFKIPPLKRPTLADVQASWDGIRSIERDDSAEGEVTVRLATVLKSDEPQIGGGDYERRLMKFRLEGGLLGFQHREWFLKNWNNPEAIPDEKVRTALKAFIGNVYIDFPGIIVVDADGDRGIPFAGGDGGRWSGDWNWIGSDFRRYGRVAVAGK